MRRLTVLLVEIGGALIGALLVLAVVLVWRLSQGPIGIEYLKPYIEEAAVDDPYRLSIGTTELRWHGFDSPVTLAAQDVAVLEVEARGGARRSIAWFPELEITVAWRPLLQGQVVAKRLTMNRPRLWARLDQEGQLGVGFSDSDTDDGMPEDEPTSGDAMESLMDDFVAPPEEGGRAMLSEIEISDGRLIVVDERRNTIWRGQQMEARMVSQPNAVTGIFEVSLETSTAGSVGFAQGSLTHDLSGGGTDVQLILDGIEANSLASVLLPDREVPQIDVPLEGVVAATIAPDLTLTKASFDIRAENGTLDAHDVLLRPLEFDRIGAAGTYSATDNRLDISALSMSADPFDAVVSGSLSQEDDGWTAVASVSATSLPVDRFEIYWPKAILPSVRNWVVVKTFGGTVDTLDAAGQMRFTQDDGWKRELVSLDGQFTGSGLNLNPLHGLPPLRGLQGSATFDANGLEISVPMGTSLDAQVSEGQVSITGFGEPTQDVDIEFVAAGSLATALYYLDRPRLRLIEKLGIPANSSDGRVAGRVRLRFPIKPHLSLDDVSAIAAANIRDGRIQLNPRWRLDGTSATLSVDQASVNLDGSGDLDGIPVSFSARRLIGSDERFDTQVSFDANLEADRLADFGIPPPPSLVGPIDVAIQFREGGGTQLVDLDADLSEAGMAVTQIDWAKAAGEPGRLTGTMRLENWVPMDISDFAFEGAGLNVTGNAAFTLAPDDDRPILASLDVSQLTLDENDLSGTIVRREDGSGWQVAIAGRSLSLNPLMQRVDPGGTTEDSDGGGAGGGQTGGGGASAPETATGDPPSNNRLTDLPVTVEADIDTVIVGEGRQIDRAVGRFVHDGERWDSITLSGMAVDAERDMEATLSAEYSYELTDDRNLRVSTSNVGTLLNALNITDQVFGGEMALTARLAVEDRPPFEPSDPAMLGEVVMTSYRVVRAPAMAQLLVALSLNGLQGELDEAGILFNGLEADFTFDRGVLTVANGETGGSGLGLTLEGTLDTNESVIDMDGTIVPIRGINRLLNQVPVLGELLGGKDEGLFAFTYKLIGPLDSPRAEVNPISVLAPGVLRDIFRFDASPRTEREDREAVGESG